MARRNYLRVLTHASSHHVVCIVFGVVSGPWIYFQGLPFGVYQQAQLVHGVRLSAPLDPIVATNITIAVAQTTIEMADRRLTSLRRKRVGTRSSGFLGRVGLESLWSRLASAADNGDGNLGAEIERR